jgi:regulation of enolase protein 1 (concanavalin A-like superfamily)
MKYYAKLTTFFIGLIAIVTIDAQATPNATVSDFQARPVNFNGTGNAYPYRLFVPDGYNLPENAGRQYPLVLFMHGLGEGPNPSDNISQVTGAGAPVLGLVTGANRDSFPAFILCPQIVCDINAPNRTEWIWGDSTTGTPYNTKRIIDLLRNEFLRIDANKIYATGLSLGAMGTWAQLQYFPNYYAAGLPMAWNNAINNAGSAAILAQTSLWVFYGDQDSYRYSKWNDPVNDVNTTRAAGGYVVFSRYPDGTHGTNTWGTAGNTRGFYTPGLMQWLTGQQKGVANTTQAPFISFSPPVTGTTYTTSSTALNLAGTASDAMGGGVTRTISGLTWTNDRGSLSGAATGTTSWLANGIILQSGVNKIQLLATDNQSTTFNRLLTVTQSAAPTNVVPSVDAGVDKTVTLPAGVNLSGSVTDDGVAPGSASPTAAWTQISGPGTATCTPANAAVTNVTFSAAGTYVLRLTGSDGVLSASDDVNVTVNAASSGSSIRFDFGGIATNGGAVTAGNWNNVTDVSTIGVKVANAINTTGASTGVALNVTAVFANINYNGSTSASGLYPATAMQDSFFVQDAQVAKVKLQGLTVGTPYTLLFFGSRMGTGANRVTSYKVGVTAVTLDATDNVTNSATLSNLLPAADGTIEVEIKNNTGVGYGYLGVLEVQTAASPWTSVDIGAVGLAGSATESAGTYTVSGSGASFTSNTDQFQYIYQAANGDCSIVARIVSVSGTWQAYSGVMIRENLNTASKHAFMGMTGQGTVFSGHASANDTWCNSQWSTGAPPYWVKLTRSGNVFTGSRSPDGVTWTVVLTANITMNANVSIGLMSSSANNTTLSTATYNQVTVVP